MNNKNLIFTTDLYSGVWAPRVEERRVLVTVKENEITVVIDGKERYAFPPFGLRIGEVHYFTDEPKSFCVKCLTEDSFIFGWCGNPVRRYNQQIEWSEVFLKVT